MTDHSLNNLEPKLPALPSGGASIQGPRVNWGPVGMRGEATLELPLPISPGRGFTPSLSLNYRSSQGNGAFGLGWSVPVATISRDTRRGVPAYDEHDRYISPYGVEMIPERGANSAIEAKTWKQFNGLALNESHRVVRYFPIVEGRFDRIEHWSTTVDGAGFWLVQGADGCVHLFGKTPAGRCADPNDSTHVAQWLLQESLNPMGEHIYYEYQQEDQGAPASRDYRAQRYLARVCYGNRVHRAHLALWNTHTLAEKQWHFELLLDYGERHTELTKVPTYARQQDWTLRKDPFSGYAFGFELGTQRLCQQLLMFHYFPNEPGMGAEPVLTRRLLLEYSTSQPIGSCIRALHTLAYDAQGNAHAWPPLELAYSAFKPMLDTSCYQPFDAMAGVNDGHHYQLVDLYNDGLPGLLHRTDKSWYYREPLRAPAPAGSESVAYGPWKALPRLPLGDTRQATHQALADLNGDGHLEWVVAQPGLSGFFTLGADRQWSGFTPFAALPQEFFHPHGQLADLMGDGRYDLVLVGSNSVRLYASREGAGYAPGLEVPHTDDEALPTLSHSSTELIVFCDLLGSGQQHLVRIRHNEIKCWPNLGRGRFGKGFLFATLPFAYGTFDAAHVRLADLDGSGAVDLLYLETGRALIFMNQAGRGLAASAMSLPWPEGVQYDATCQVCLADLQGLGCASLVLSVPHMTARHWRCDFVTQKPYLLTTTVNNMGAVSRVTYRSSAQEWLDEKQQWQAQGKAAASGLPFPVQVVQRHEQKDLISSDVLTRHFTYREGSYDSLAREFIGFGLLLETDCAPSDKTAAQDSNGLLTKRWFHTLTPTRQAFYAGDTQAPALGPNLLSQPVPGSTVDTLVTHPAASARRQANRALYGNLLREETYAAADTPEHAVPFSVQQQRYLVRQLRPAQGSGEPAVLLPLLLESVTCNYERQADDPVCQHAINLRWDRYASLAHSLLISYARRKTATDPAPSGTADEQQWWRDAHDPAQQAYYLTETLAHCIHLDEPQHWRLQLPYQLRSNVLVVDKATLASGNIGYEHFIADDPSNPLGPKAERQLAGLSVHHYCQGDCTAPMSPGTASFQGLLAYVEVAELDEHDLKVYQANALSRTPPLRDITQWLLEKRYRPLAVFLPTATRKEDARTLWSAGKGYKLYGKAEEFYRPRRHQASLSHGFTQTEYDAYWLNITEIKTPDGCSTQARYDYRLGLPVMTSDAQRTEHYAHYTAHGQLIASGLKGKEMGKPVGEDITTQGVPTSSTSPAQALAAPEGALLKAQAACFYDPFSWMGRIPSSSLQPQWIQSGYLLPDGYIRASAHSRLDRLTAAKPDQLVLKALIQAAKREPVHAVVLRADRLAGTAGETERQIQIALAFSDGFGRVRQTLEKAQAGPALTVDDTGALQLDAKQTPIEAHAGDRWRVSGRLEYDNRGLLSRTWRPYFVNRTGFVNDTALRTVRPSEQHFHDALGRAIRILNGNADTRRETYRAWYTISEDENDTQAPAT